MKPHRFMDTGRRLIGLLLVALAGCAAWPVGDASAEASPQRLLRIEDVAVVPLEQGVALTISASGAVSRYRTAAGEAASEMVIDILHPPPRLPAATFAVETPGIEKIDVNYLADRIRSVILFDGALPAAVSSAVLDRQLRFRFEWSKAISPVAQAGPAIGARVESAPGRQKAGGVDEPILRDASVHAGPKTILEQLPESPTQKALVRDVQEAEGAELALFRNSLAAFRREEWTRAVTGFEQLSKAALPADFDQRVAFLLAASKDGLAAADEKAPAWRDVVRQYEEAVHRFPDSGYIPLAYLALGRLYHRKGYTAEALAYYSMAIERGSDAVVEAAAMMQKARILGEKDRFPDALALLESVIQRLGPEKDATEARVEMAKIYHGQQRFQQAKALLAQLADEDPLRCHRFPDIPLYLGHCHRQLGDPDNAAGFYLQHINLRPEGNDVSLTGALIGDCYRDAGRPRQAAKIYRLVADRYPDSEGAIICLIRLAEQQLPPSADGRQAVIPDLIFERRVGEARRIYEEIGSGEALDAAQKPLPYLANLKLAVLHHKEGRDEESLAILNSLLENPPPREFFGTIAFVRDQVVPAALRQKMQDGAYHEIVELYYRDHCLFEGMVAPECLLPVALAMVHAKLPTAAAELFRRIDALMAESEKPAEVFYHLALSDLEHGRLAEAEARLRRVVERYPTHELAPGAFVHLADALRRQNRYEEADEMFAKALSFSLPMDRKMEILVSRAEMLTAAGRADDALAVLKPLSAANPAESGDPELERRMGDLFFDLRRYPESLEHYTAALRHSDDPAAHAPLMFKIGRCHRQMEQYDQALEMFSRVSSQGDPVWSPLAAEMMAEIRFHAQAR
jgi:tetratricopeptide (TPR) repeat protein